jgi:hypothetical protein
MQADDSWLRYFESAFEKAAKVRRISFVLPYFSTKYLLFFSITILKNLQASHIEAKVALINEELIINSKP